MSPECRPGDVESFRGLVARRLGLQFDDSKLGELGEVLAKRLLVTRELPAAYIGRLDGPEPPRGELRALAHELAVHETYFFRNTGQFRALAECALPDRIRANAHSRRLRLLSAGCASGEEPYSLAMLVIDRPELSGWEVSIRGADVSVTMLDKAAKGRYSAWSLRETPSEVRTRHFQADGRDLVLDATVRKMVAFEERNLADAESGLFEPESLDVVLCRNVLMYFTPETAQRTVARISRALAPGGFLFLGHAETLRGLSQDFHLRHTHGTFYYQRREEAERPSKAREQRQLETVPAIAIGDLAADESWIETIRHSSDRIRTLTASATTSDRRSSTIAPGSGRQLATRGLDTALALLQQEQFSEAQTLLGRLPPEAASDPDVLLLKAVLLTHGGDLALAEQLSHELLALDELSAGAHYVLALCRDSAGDRSGAEEHDEAALYLDPAFAMPRLHLGLLARRSGDIERAQRELGQALALLQREDASRVLMFGGGFNREALVSLCRAEYLCCGGSL